MAAASIPTPAPHVVRQLRPRQQPQGGNQQSSANGGGNGGNGNPNSNVQSASNSNSNSQAASNSNSQSASGSQSGSGSQASSGSGSAASSTSLNIPQTAPAGGIQFTQPPQTAAASYYKIAPSQLITFGWNLTSLILTPSQLTVSAFCADNGNTYPVGPTDGVIPGTATQVVWDPYSYQQAHPTQPLIIASYTLQVMDNHGLTQLPEPGRFAPNTQMKFALYKPQEYTPLASWSCSGCSFASHTASAHPLYISLVVTLLAMLLGGWGIIRRR